MRNEQYTGVVVFIAILVISILGLIHITIQQSHQVVRNSCDKESEVYDESQNICRDKTVSERFAEKCTGSVFVDGNAYTCAELKKLGLEKAYLNNTIIKHGGKLYERGTSAEIAAGKQAGEYCLTAADTWQHIGEKRCVVFSYEYMSCSNGYCFLNEKKNYTSGFVAFFGRYNMYSWESFKNEYYSAGPILVCGTITTYQGHPQIKITSTSQVLKKPTATYGAYNYSCK